MSESTEPPIGSRVRHRGAIFRRFEDGRWRVEEDTTTWLGLTRNGDVEVIEVASAQAEPADRIGEHFRVAGWIEDESTQDDYCGFCSHESHGGAPASHVEWPCPEVRAAFNSSPDSEAAPASVVREVPACQCDAVECPIHADTRGAGAPLREVPASEAREGDTVTIVGTAGHYRQMPDRGLIVGDLNVKGRGEEFHLYDTTVTVTRPVPPLPDQPGAVGTATVCNVPGVEVFLTRQNGKLEWVTTGGVFHDPSDLADFLPAGAGVPEGGKR